MSLEAFTRAELIRAGARHVADVEVRFIKAPWISEETAKQKITQIINRLHPYNCYAVSDIARVSFVRHPGIYKYESELWQAGSPAIPWVAIALALLTGIVIGGLIVVAVWVKPLRETVKAQTKTLEQIEQEIINSDLPQEQKEKILKEIREAKEKGKTALEETAPAEALPTLPKELTELLKWVPYIIIGLFLIEIIRAIRR